MYSHKILQNASELLTPRTSYLVFVFSLSCTFWTIARLLISIKFEKYAAYITTLVHSVVYASYFQSTWTQFDPSTVNTSDEDNLLMIAAGYLGHLLWFNGFATLRDKLGLISTLTTITIILRIVNRGSGGSVAVAYLYLLFSTAPSRGFPSLGSSVYKASLIYLYVLCASWAFVIHQFLIVTLPLTLNMIKSDDGMKLIEDIFP